MDTRSDVLLNENDASGSDLPVGLTTRAFIRASNGESVGSVGGIVVGGDHAPETFGVIAVFAAEIVGEAGG
jgi:hypothetical protein